MKKDISVHVVKLIYLKVILVIEKETVICINNVSNVEILKIVQKKKINVSTIEQRVNVLNVEVVIYVNIIAKEVHVKNVKVVQYVNTIVLEVNVENVVVVKYVNIIDKEARVKNV